MSTTVQTIRDQVIAEARSLPDLIAKAKNFDPVLADQLTTKAAIGSKSLWGGLVTFGVTWAVAKWGLGLDANTCALVSGLISYGIGFIVRRFTDPRTTGFFKAA